MYIYVNASRHFFSRNLYQITGTADRGVLGRHGGAIKSPSNPCTSRNPSNPPYITAAKAPLLKGLKKSHIYYYIYTYIYIYMSEDIRFDGLTTES